MCKFYKYAAKYKHIEKIIFQKLRRRFLRQRRTNLELLAVHGGDFRLLADGEGVGHSLPGGLGGDDKVVAALLDLGDGLDVLGHLDHVGRELCKK